MLYGIIGLLLGMLLVYLWVGPKLKIKIKLDNDIKEQNNIIKQNNATLQMEQTSLKNNLQTLRDEQLQLGKAIKDLQSHKEFQEQTMQKDFDNKAHLLELQYKNLEKQYLEDYYEIMEDAAHECSTTNQTNKVLIDELTNQMNTLKSEVQAAQAEKKRSQEELQKQDFYTLQLDILDIQEIKIIKSIENRLRDALPLNKIIWSSYYRPAYNALKARVLGAEEKTGIYKLINNKDGMVYIGQALKIGNRWSEHIKCGLGAAPAPSNKLYNSMRETGPENFSFILLEECTSEELNQKEKFWIDFYDSKNIGLNETGGNNT